MIPTRKFLWLFVLFSLPVGFTLADIRYGYALIPVVLLMLLALFDRLVGTRTPVEIKRNVNPIISVGVSNRIHISAHNTSRLHMSLSLLDEPPDNGSTVPESGVIKVELPPAQTVETSYIYIPRRRGRYQFSALRVLHRSRLGFWSVHRRLPLTDEIHVYPNIEAMHRFEILARVNHLDEFGVRTIRMKGDGTEFERLRDYREGDEQRKVDWKATARFGKLIVREMGRERNQNLLMMIDTGRMMRQKTAGLSHFDYALNTAIILGHVAAKRGDNVGAVLFSDRIRKFIALGRGRSTVDGIVRSCYDMEPETVATNYNRLFKFVASRVRKRSLLILMTHFVPGEDHYLIRTFMSMLGKQHLPLCLFFREPSLEEQVDRIPRSARESFHRAAAADLLIERYESLAHLHHSGIMAVDALPGQLSAVAIGNYLDIKARNLL